MNFLFDAAKYAGGVAYDYYTGATEKRDDSKPPPAATPETEPYSAAKVVGKMTYEAYKGASEKRDEKNEENEKTSSATTTKTTTEPEASASAPEPIALEMQHNYVCNDTEMFALVQAVREISDGKFVDGEETTIPPGYNTCVGRGDGKDLVKITLTDDDGNEFVATKQKCLMPGMSLSVRFTSGRAFVVNAKAESIKKKYTIRSKGHKKRGGIPQFSSINEN